MSMPNMMNDRKKDWTKAVKITNNFGLQMLSGKNNRYNKYCNKKIMFIPLKKFVHSRKGKVGVLKTEAQTSWKEYGWM